MSVATGNAAETSPWLSVWFKPGDTIERIVAAGRPGGVLVAALGTAGLILVSAIDVGLTAAVTDWRILSALVVAGLIGGILLLYVNGVFVALIGDAIGGQAWQPEVRAVLAWSLVPNAVGLAITLAALAGLKLSGAADSPQPMSGAVGLGVRTVTSVLELWAVVAAVLMLRRVQGFGVLRAIIALVAGWIVSVVALAIALAVPIRIFLFQPFNIPAGSMMPTLLVGDYMFVSKYSYGYSRYSLPFSPPLFSGRVLASEPQRGDVVVFRLPKDDTVDYVKRIVGLPGDRIQMIDGMIHINGKAIERERVEDFVDPDDGNRIRREILPNGVSYFALDLMDNGFLDNTQVYNVPAGHYFMLGDNLDNSNDSRVLSQVGYVPFENIVGRAEIVFFSIAPTSGGKPPAIRYDRIGVPIR